MKLDVRALWHNIQGMAGQIALAVAVTILFVLSGYAARAGLQSMTMLALSTALMSSRLKGDARALGFGAAACIAATAALLAFVVPAGTPSGFRLALAMGFGTWLVVGAILLARGAPGRLATRRPEAWTWIVGAATWLAITLTYADTALVASSGKLASYLWVPWASAGFLVGGVVVPWWVQRRPPPPARAASTWALSTGRGIVTGLAIGAAIALVLPFAAQLAGGVAPTATSEPSETLVFACDACDPDQHILALQALPRDDGILIVIQFAAPPTELTLHAAGGTHALRFANVDGAWRLFPPPGLVLPPDAISVVAEDALVGIEIHHDPLEGPVAVSTQLGNRAPTGGYVIVD